MKKVLFFLIFILVTAIIFSEPLFMPRNEYLDSLLTFYNEAGYVFPVQSYPLTRNRVIDFAENLLKKELKPNVRSKLEELIKKLNVKTKKFSLEIDWQTSYEHYFRTREITISPVNDYIDEEPLGRLALSLADYDYGGICLEGTLKREYSTYPESNLFAGIEGNPLATENQFISKGYIYFNNEFIQVVFGRAPVHWGDPRFSTLLPSETLPFLDQIKFDFTIDDFKLEFYAATLENREAADDLDLSLNQTVYTDNAVYFGKNTIWSMMHRLAYSFDTFRISLAEHIFVSRSDNQIYIGDFLPLTVWHNANVGFHNLSMIIDMNWAVFPGLDLFIQAGFDDINASDFFGINDTGLPTIDAYILGLNFCKEIFDLPLTVKIEVGTTHYLWGNFYQNNYPFQKAIYRIYLDGENQLIPMTSPYGPGAIWVEANTEINTTFGLSGCLFFNYLNKNTLADLVSTAYERADEVMAEAPRLNQFEAGIELSYKLFGFTEFYLIPAFLYQFESSSSGAISDPFGWFEMTVGGKLSGKENF